MIDKCQSYVLGVEVYVSVPNISCYFSVVSYLGYFNNKISTFLN